MLITKKNRREVYKYLFQGQRTWSARLGSDKLMPGVA